jgi:hypothetical protein
MSGDPSAKQNYSLQQRFNLQLRMEQQIMDLHDIPTNAHCTDQNQAGSSASNLSSGDFNGNLDFRSTHPSVMQTAFIQQSP